MSTYVEPFSGRAAARNPMLTVCLSVELMRSRPALVFWWVVLFQAGIWTVLPGLLYGAPPGDVAMSLAVGRHWAFGYPSGPPLAVWLAQLAFELAGHRAIGIYVLAQACVVVTLWAVFALARAIVGAQHALIAVLLMTGTAAFTVTTPAFGKPVLVAALVALACLHFWRAVGEGRGAYFW